MEPLDFPQWPEVLAQSALPHGLKRTFEITVRWYLGFCPARASRGDCPVGSRLHRAGRPGETSRRLAIGTVERGHSLVLPHGKGGCAGLANQQFTIVVIR